MGQSEPNTMEVSRQQNKQSAQCQIYAAQAFVNKKKNPGKTHEEKKNCHQMRRATEEKSEQRKQKKIPESTSNVNAVPFTDP